MIDPPVKVARVLVVEVVGATVMIELVGVGTTGGPVGKTGGLLVVVMGLGGTTGLEVVIGGAIVGLGFEVVVLGGGTVAMIFFLLRLL